MSGKAAFAERPLFLPSLSANALYFAKVLIRRGMVCPRSSELCAGVDLQFSWKIAKFAVAFAPSAARSANLLMFSAILAR